MTLLENTMAAVARRAHGCDHSGLHSPLARYSRRDREIRYLTVCDRCGAETGEVHRETYTPNFDPTGNDSYISALAGA